MIQAPARSLRLTSPPGDVDAVHALLEGLWAEAPEVSARDRFSFETALIELAANVIRHADPGCGVTCTLTVGISDNRMEALLLDTGQPGELELVGATMPDGEAESGRGIPLIQALVTELEYVREGNLNRWQMSRLIGS